MVRLPPLRARLEDLGLLIASLLEQLAPDGAAWRLSRSAARALFRHGWSLNVRELEQALRAAPATARDDEIRAADLRLAHGASEAEAEPTPEPDGRARLVALLDHHAGNLSAVARDLATSRSQVARLLARHRLVPDEYKRR